MPMQERTTELTILASMPSEDYGPAEETSAHTICDLHEADLEPQLVFLSEGRVDVALVRLPSAPLPDGINIMTLRRASVVACLRHDHELDDATGRSWPTR